MHCPPNIAYKTIQLEGIKYNNIVHFFKANSPVKIVSTSYQHFNALCGYFILIVNQCFTYFVHIVWKTSA
jgi:hypothetical protein